MSILSVSLPPEIESFLEREIASGEFETKSQIVKKALRKLEEDLIIDRILKASKEAHEGKILQGDLKALAKHLK